MNLQVFQDFQWYLTCWNPRTCRTGTKLSSPSNHWHRHMSTSVLAGRVSCSRTAVHIGMTQGYRHWTSRCTCLKEAKATASKSQSLCHIPTYPQMAALPF